MPLQDLLNREFGVKTQPIVNPLVTQLEVTATKFLPNNPNRLSFVFVNLGATECYIGLGGDVSASKGIRVSASGGVVTMKWSEDFNMVAWEWWGLAVTAADKCYVISVDEQEGER